MYCSNCGEKLEGSVKFCSNCGNTINTDGTITFERKNQFYGVLVPIKVFLDGNLVATLNANSNKVVPVSFGTHKIAFNLWSGNNQYDITVTKDEPNIKVLFKLSVGLVTSKPKILSIESIK